MLTNFTINTILCNTNLTYITTRVSFSVLKSLYGNRGVSISLRYPQGVVVSGPVRRRGPDDRLVSCWLHRDGLLGKAVEQLPSAVRLAPVEPEGKLVQIAIQMLDAHRSLMCTQQPSF